MNAYLEMSLEAAMAVGQFKKECAALKNKKKSDPTDYTNAMVAMLTELYKTDCELHYIPEED